MNDLGSGNGTLVNGARQPSTILYDGDTIEVGTTTLRFEHPSSVRAAQQAAPVPGVFPPSPVAFPPSPVGPAAFPPSPVGQAAFPPEPLEEQPPERTPTAPPLGQPTPAEGSLRRGGFLNTPMKKAIVGGAAVVVVLS